MPRRTKEQVQETREILLQGALDVFSKKGFSRTTLEDIARHVHLTRGAVYWHFKNKQDLLIALIKTMMQREEALVLAKVPALETLDDLQAYFLARVDVIEENKTIKKFIHFIFMQVEWATEKKVAALSKEFPKKFTVREAPFGVVDGVLALARERGEIRPDVDLDRVFDILAAMVSGLVRGYLCGMARTPLRTSVKMAVQSVLDGIRAP